MVTGSGVRSIRRRPCASSMLMTDARACSGVNSAALARKYSSRSRWKSRWSRPRLRNTATSNVKPSTRSCTMAWLETSMTHTSTASSRITANSDWSAGASGVVSDEAAGTPAMRVPMVPTTADRRAPSAASARYVVVVLPWVPVTPMVVNASAGWSWNQALRSASNARGCSTTRVGTSSASTRAAPSASVSTATAPASRAAAAWSAPCDLEPGSAAYTSPGSTCAVLRLMPVSSVASPPMIPRWAATSARV